MRRLSLHNLLDFRRALRAVRIASFIQGAFERSTIVLERNGACLSRRDDKPLLYCSTKPFRSSDIGETTKGSEEASSMISSMMIYRMDLKSTLIVGSGGRCRFKAAVTAWWSLMRLETITSDKISSSALVIIK